MAENQFELCDTNMNELIDRQSTMTRRELESMSQRIRDGDKDAVKFIIIDQKVFDVTEFIQDHPGGAQVLLTHIGKDASGNKI